MGQPLPLLGGAYTARSVIANVQRCVNLFPEKNREDADSPFTYYPTPGLVLKATAPVTGEVRGLYNSTNGKLFVVVVNKLYYVDTGFNFTLLGTLTTNVGIVSMQDNGEFLTVVDGGLDRYLVDILTLTFSVDNTSYVPALKVCVLDNYTIFNVIGTNEFFSTTLGTTTLDPLYYSSKSAYPDWIQTIGVTNRNLWLIGKETCEVWNNAGGETFPFDIVQGVYVEQGCAAPYSLAKHDLKLFWLAQNKNGWAHVLMAQGYKTVTVSNKAIENEINKYAVKNDAIGYCYEQAGHVFYVLTFPSADKTWVLSVDDGMVEWHERCWIDSNGQEHRHRSNCHTFAYGMNLVGDWENGKLYAFSTTTYTDDGGPIIRRRGFPHINKSGNLLEYAGFSANMNAGEVLSGTTAVSLRWSDDRGKSWGNPLQQDIGALGEYDVQMQWGQLGTARDKIFELFWAINGEIVLQGAYLDLGPESDV